MDHGLSGNESKLEQRIGALESALTNLQQRFADLGAQVQRQDDTFALISDVALYGQLRDALATGLWQEADAQTNEILFASINTSSDEVTPEEVEALPSATLRILDQLWSSHSGGRFGFRAQVRIYQELGGTLQALIAQDAAIYRTFCERVGWRHDGSMQEPDDLERELPINPAEAAEGLMPRRCWIGPYGMKITNLLMARLISSGVADHDVDGHGLEHSD